MTADSWFGKDKMLHFGASSLITLIGFLIGLLFFKSKEHALLFGAAIATIAGIGKEVYDLAGYGDPSWKDLTWDAIGIIVTSLIIYIILTLTS